MKKNKKNPLQKVGIRYKERETISRERKQLRESSSPSLRRSAENLRR